MITPLTPLPLPPTRQDPVNFAARADAFLAALPDFQIELNTLASELDSIGINATQSEINAAQSATNAQDAAIAAGSFANYKGLWSSLTGALNKPASVKHNGKYWNLLNNLANVQSSEPGVSADWEESDIVRVSGADFTGPVTVPSGATGNQVPTADDVTSLTSGKADKTGATFTGLVGIAPGTSVGTAGSTGSLLIGNNTGSAATQSFSKSGYAINFGLDSDNVVRLGGWSQGANTYRFTSDTSGNFVATGNLTAYSDRRLKTDLQTISDPLLKIRTLTGYTYKRVDTGQRQVGLIAQDVQEVLPEAVMESDGILTVSYGNLVALLVEAIKSLEDRIEVLEKGI